MDNKIISAAQLSVEVASGDVLIKFHELPDIALRVSPNDARDFAGMLMVKANMAEGRAPHS